MRTGRFILLFLLMSAFGLQQGFAKKGYYLFAYFTSNSTEGQQIWYAVSENGVDFTPINNGRPVVAADSIARSGGVRDPHILRTETGDFYMVATDMDYSKGKWTNRGFVMMKSRNLVHWEHHQVHFPERYAGKDPAKANAVWAPQTIYDPSVGKYMIYFSLHSEKDGPYPSDAVYYVYANADFTGVEGDPERLFTYGGPSIDTDIVRDRDGVYHLFFNTWGGEFKGTARREYTFTDLHNQSGWTLIPGRIQPTQNNSEGSCAYPCWDGGWLMVYDCFKDGVCQFCKSDDLINFTLAGETKTSGAFTPRHGTVITITKKEYKRLMKAEFGK